MSPSRISRLLALILSLSIVSGCISSARFGSVPAGETLRVSVHPEGSSPEQSVANQTIAGDTGTGLASGMLVGAAWGLTCGPFFWFCAPLGSLAGAVVGGTAGLVVGVAESLPRDKALALEQELTDYLAGRDPDQELLGVLGSRAAVIWLPGTGETGWTLEFKLVGLGLHTHRQERVTLVLRASAQLIDASAAGGDPYPVRAFEYESPQFYADSWIGGQMPFVQQQFDTAYRALAEDIVTFYSR